MAKEELIEMRGRVEEVLPDSRYRVVLENGRRITVASEVSAAVARSVMVRRADRAGSATTIRATRCSAGEREGSRALIWTIRPPVAPGGPVASAGASFAEIFDPLTTA